MSKYGHPRSYAIGTHRGSFGSHCVVANIWGTEAASVPCDNREIVVAFPPLFGIEEVLAIDTSDPAIAKCADFCNDPPDCVGRSITDVGES